APVRISITEQGFLSIVDKGFFAIQHELMPEEVASDPNVIIEDNVTIHPDAGNLVIVTHGWLDKGQNSWPADLANAIYGRTDPNQWTCGVYDWKGGSVVITSIQAAEYARDIAGPRLAAAVLKLDKQFDHIHFIAHSAGSWVIDAAAEHIADRKPDTEFHLTFLDAYVPGKWRADDLGRVFKEDIPQTQQYWAEHYYTKDITSKVTHNDLRYAHNVDISALDPLIAEHEFPYRWYTATVTGRYRRWDEKNKPVITQLDNTDYGFTRGLEAGDNQWKQSLKLQMDNKALKFKKK
ncbi:MAG: hypothetical protein ACYTET_03985, partial [Planctomycetota bacterium]